MSRYVGNCIAVPGARRFPRLAMQVVFTLCIGSIFARPQTPAPPWRGVLQNEAGSPIGKADVKLDSADDHETATTSTNGSFVFTSLRPATYSLSVHVNKQAFRSSAAMVTLIVKQNGDLIVGIQQEKAAAGGEQLTSKAVSEIPLNKRDFSQLLLLAAGTAADSSGASNFTQQFAINGQRGVEAVFALDGADISDPEIGGGTFTNFNVDAVLELQSLSGVMPAEIGRGASGFTNILTRSGMDSIHGSIFEFLRNSSLDARNYFDYSSPLNPGRIPPFKRNEFGFTNGGPVLIPHVYDGRGKLFYYVEYQGFRQVLGTTQVFAVPTHQQRIGIDTTAFAGDTLTVPVNSAISDVLARYPLPNLPQGTFGVNSRRGRSDVRECVRHEGTESNVPGVASGCAPRSKAGPLLETAAEGGSDRLPSLTLPEFNRKRFDLFGRRDAFVCSGRGRDGSFRRRSLLVPTPLSGTRPRRQSCRIAAHSST
jgi:hypothetical protein